MAYNFVTKEAFLDLVAQNGFIEHGMSRLSAHRVTKPGADTHAAGL